MVLVLARVRRDAHRERGTRSIVRHKDVVRRTSIMGHHASMMCKRPGSSHVWTQSKCRQGLLLHCWLVGSSIAPPFSLHPGMSLVCEGVNNVRGRNRFCTLNGLFFLRVGNRICTPACLSTIVTIAWPVELVAVGQ